MIKTIARVIIGGLLIVSVVLGVSFISLEGAGAQSTTAASACEGSGGTWAPQPTPDNIYAGVCSTPGDTRTVTNTLQQVSNILIFIVGSVSVLMAIIGGLRYSLAQGDNNAVSAAKNTVLYAIVGIVVSVMAYGLVNFVTFQLG